MKGFVKEQYAAKVRKQIEALKAEAKKLREQLRAARKKLTGRRKSAAEQPPR
jgi:predicted  nucleic acid-binding Zn-ribbon protein